MAVAFGARDWHHNFTSASDVSTAITFTNGVLYVLHSYLRLASGGGTPAIPAVSASGTMAFVRVPSLDKTGTISNANDSRLATFVAIGNGASETITFTPTAAPNEGWWAISHWTGATTTNGGLDAILQGVPGNGGGADPSLALAALQDAGSMAVGVLAVGGSSPTVGAGFTIIGSNDGVAVNQNAEYQSNVTTVNWTHTAANWIADAYEIAGPAATAGTPVVPIFRAIPFTNNQRI